MQTTIESVLPGGQLYLADDAGWFARLRVGVRALRILTGVPDDCFAAPAFHLSMDRETWERVATGMWRTVEGRALLTERPNLQAGEIDLSALRSLPEGTLGYALARYYEDNAIKPFESPYPADSHVKYLAKRYREIHDVAHLVTGYGTDAVGELELQAFVLGNLGLRQCVLILLFTPLFPPSGFPGFSTYARRLLAAYWRGRRSGDVAIKPRYERFWQSTLDEVRQHVGLAPGRP